MQQISIVCVGKLKEKFYIEAFEEYSKRLKGLCSFSCVELQEIRLGDSPSQKEIESALDKEAEKIRSVIPQNSFCIALCVEGKSISSEKLSQLISDRAMSGKPDIAFIIGSSYGLSEKLKNVCDYKLSMSALTFPHHLARIILAEQIYRAYKIMEGSKYHK